MNATRLTDLSDTLTAAQTARRQLDRAITSVLGYFTPRDRERLCRALQTVREHQVEAAAIVTELRRAE
jgi:hypothetical protein